VIHRGNGGGGLRRYGAGAGRAAGEGERGERGERRGEYKWRRHKGKARNGGKNQRSWAGVPGPEKGGRRGGTGVVGSKELRKL